MAKPCTEVVDNNKCMGCFGCANACARDAITMQLSSEGFYRPVIDVDRCNGCGVCVTKCPALLAPSGCLYSGQWNPPRIFLGWSTDKNIHWSSSSGGLFSELANDVLAQGGTVVGCAWGDNWTPCHQLAQSKDEVAAFRGSKYVPSYVGDSYRQVRELAARSEGPVLFSGTPCQVATLKAMLSSNQRTKVLLVDFICHGVPSLIMFHWYIRELFRNETVQEYTFRDRTYGPPTVRAISSSGRRYHAHVTADPFVRGFCGYHAYLQRACYRCPFRGGSRVSDISLGDYWGAPKEYAYLDGISIACANSMAGLEALTRLQEAGRIEIKALDSYPRATARRRWWISVRRAAVMRDIAAGCTFNQIVERHYPYFRYMTALRYRLTRYSVFNLLRMVKRTLFANSKTNQ